MRSTLHWAMPYSPGLLLALALAVLAGFALLRGLSGRPMVLARHRGLGILRLLVLAVLGVILVNPVRVDETPGTVERPKVLYLVDTSQSMALGGRHGVTRWDQVLRTIREADRPADPRAGAEVSVFRFGSHLAAVEAPFWRGDAETSPRPTPLPGAAVAAEPPRSSAARPAPTDPDTLLASSLEGLAGRFGQVPPRAVVVFSDGRAREPARVDAMARAYGRMKIPVHVVPAGDEDVGGDVAIVSMVAPEQVRKSSLVAAQVFVRSYGYQTKRTELKIVSVDPAGKTAPVLARLPIALQDGLAGYTLAFNSGDADRRIEARIDPQPGEVTLANNSFGADVAIDHTKIRVLYVEGSAERFVAIQRLIGGGQGNVIKGAYSALQDALMEDPDIECTVVMPGGAGGDYSMLVRSDERGRGLPETPSELFAYDAIVLSNIPREALSDPHLAWVEEWISRRGGGLAMVGGPNSYASGQWFDTPVGKMLPFDLLAEGSDWDEALTAVQPVTDGAIHPIWHITSDEARNRAILKTFPKFLGLHRVGPLKPTAELLARAGAGADARPVLAVQPYGRGRTLAMTTGITRRWAPDFAQRWGEGGDNRYYKKFWRNAIYWLTENSSIGRRRLLAETDKRLYRPGEPIVIRARTFDENAAATLEYRVAVSVEPKSAGDVTADDSPLRRPASGPRPENGPGPLLPWGEEFNLAKLPAETAYTAALPVSDAKSLPTGVTLTQPLRIELTAYEGNTQVDSTALEVQVLDDPSEQQNPLPDHELLRDVAARSGGTVLRGPGDLAAMIEKLPKVVGRPEIKRVPAWSRWGPLAALLVLLTTEWVWRRRLGLA